MKYLSVLFVFSVSFIILTINGKYLPDFVHKLNSKGWDKLAHTLIFLAIEPPKNEEVETEVKKSPSFPICL